MKIAVLGAGQQGTACVYDLLQNRSVSEIGVADTDKERADLLVAGIRRFRPDNSMTTLSAFEVDVTDPDQLTDFLALYDVVISAVPYFLNLRVTEAAIAAKTHMVDMGGNTDLVFEQRKLDAQAKQAGVTILPDCGLAPGMANIIAAHGIAQMDQVESLKIRVGGLPQAPQPPLNYQLFFSVHGLINEYIGQSIVIRDGKITSVETLTEIETVHLAQPIGHPPQQDLEAFHTLGGLSTLPWTFADKVRNMDYKTLRYPGHCQQIKTMADLGLMAEEPRLIDGQTIRPRDVFAAVVSERLNTERNGWNPRDVVVVLITIEGSRAGQPVHLHYELIDHYDEATGLTAMMRTTAFPVSIVAQMLGDGTIGERGVLPLETTVPTQPFIDALLQRNLRLQTAAGSRTR
ncbi:MAG TPA: saccharopine dehydrogenase C-terminal domain-containing protein [Coleofasciculaceae cyanobacterium]